MTKASTTSVPGDNLCWVTAPGYPTDWSWDEKWSDRQERIDGYDQTAVEQTSVWVFGCNGLGRTVAEVLTRKGYGRIGLCDPDVVELTNLNRTLWKPESIGEFKAMAAIRELCAVAPRPTEYIGFPGKLQEVLNRPELMTGISACLVGIDNDHGRALACRSLRRMGIPAVFYSLSPDTYSYEVFVQEPEGPCWACIHPDPYKTGLQGESRQGCPRTPAIADSCFIAVGYCCYALDSLIAARPRFWNLNRGYLHGEVAGRFERRTRSADCPCCGTP